jgi:hypothetical protein
LETTQQHNTPIKHAGNQMDQTSHPTYLQVDNKLKNLTELDLLKNNLWLISYEINNREITLEHQNNPQIFSGFQKNMR